MTSTVRQAVAMTNATHFSGSKFVEAVSKSSDGRYQLLAMDVIGSGPKRAMYAVEEVDRFGRRSVSLSAFGLYASPGWEGKLGFDTVHGIVRALSGIRFARFTWTVRFDHVELAEHLQALGINQKTHSTHILDLDADFDRVFAGFSATIRNQIRACDRKGVVVQRVFDEKSIRRYYDIYRELAREQRREWSYPVELFLELAREKDSTFFLMAIVDGEIIGGGVFFCDGNSMRYWHGAASRAFSRYFPTCAVVAHAIRHSCEIGKKSFGFGGSMGKESLEAFKSYWGAKRREYWEFEWRNPIWISLSNLRAKLGGFLD